MTIELRRLLTRHAFEVGAILNAVTDDDDRELLQAHFESTLNNELYAGSVNRRDAAEHAARIINLLDQREKRGRVVDIFSRRAPKGAA